MEPVPTGGPPPLQVAVLTPTTLFTDLLVDALQRRGLRTGGTTLSGLDSLPAGCVLIVDATGPVGDERDARLQRTQVSHVKVLLLVDRPDQAAERLVRTLGAAGWVSRQDPVEGVVRAVRNVSGPRSATKRATGDRTTIQDGCTLTLREVEILRLVAAGLGDEAAAESLHISVHTIRTHLASVRAKLGVTNRFAAVSLARKSGVLDPRDEARSS